MNTITFNIPNQLKLSPFDLKMMLAGQLYDQGHLSSGQAADMVGLSKRAFIEILGKYGISVFGYSFEEIEQDLAYVRTRNR